MLDADVLILNRLYLPIQVTTARRAFRLMYQGRAHAILPDYTTHDLLAWLTRDVAEGDDWIGLVTRRVPVPRVIVLASYGGVPRHDVRFSRRNVFARDGHRCQYCGASGRLRELNLDHVVPLAHGGTTSWENVVCCCVPCNRRKGSRRPDAAGMRLLRAPRRPRWHPLHAAGPRRRGWPSEWSSFVDPAILAWRPEAPR